MTDDKATFDSAWDEIDSTATEVAEFEGGKLYKQNAVHVIVLNGTYYEMVTCPMCCTSPIESISLYMPVQRTVDLP